MSYLTELRIIETGIVVHTVTIREIEAGEGELKSSAYNELTKASLIYIRSSLNKSIRYLVT